MSKDLFGEIREKTHEKDAKNFNYAKRVHEYWQQHHNTFSIEKMAHDFVTKYFVPKNNEKQLPF